MIPDHGEYFFTDSASLTTANRLVFGEICSQKPIQRRQVYFMLFG